MENNDNSIKEETNPNNMKSEIIKTLSSYFESNSQLENYALADEIFSVFNYVNKYIDDSEFSLGLNQVLNCYRKASGNKFNEVLELMLKSHDDFVNRENIMWSLKNKEAGSEDELYDKIMSYFEYIGTSLEVSVKGIVNELYMLICIINGKSYDYDKISKMDFGVVINNILTQSYFENIFKIRSLKLSDWRNIAKHHSYKIYGSKITCIYGKDKKAFELTYDELRDCTYKITRSSNILNIARCIYVFDNLDSITRLSKKTIRTMPFRRNMIIKQIVTMLVLQDFKIESVEWNDRILNLEILDLTSNITGSDFIKVREMCFCKILQERWGLLEVDRINIKYFDSEGEILDALWLAPVS